MTCIFFCLRSDFENVVNECVRLEEESNRKISEAEAVFNSNLEQVVKESEALKIERDDLKFRLERTSNERVLVKKELGNAKDKIQEMKQHRKELDSQIERLCDSNNIRNIEGALKQKTEEVYELNYKLDKKNQDFKNLQETLMNREIQITKVQEDKENIDSELKVAKDHLLKLSEKVEKCRCFSASHTKNLNSENEGIELENIFDKEKSYKSETSERKAKKKVTNEITFTTSIKAPMKVNMNSKINDFKKMLKIRNLSSALVSNSNRSNVNSAKNSAKNTNRQNSGQSDKLSKGSKEKARQKTMSKGSKTNSKGEKHKNLRTSHFINIVKYDTFESEKVNGEFNNETYYSQNVENYNSNKTIGTNLDEYDLNSEYNKQFDYDIHRNNFRRRQRDYKSNSIHSRSPSNSVIEEDKVSINNGETSCFGTLSKYYQKLSGKGLQYEQETENTVKDILIEKDCSPIHKNKRYAKRFSDNNDYSLSKYDKQEDKAVEGSVEMEYSYSYAQSNEGFNSNLGGNKDLTPLNTVNKQSLFSTVSVIGEEKEARSLCDLTLGSINEELNNQQFSEKENFNSNHINGYVDVGEGNYEDEDFNPK
eukprot:CAMPEP_0170524214 /NCGR_PEP_ID=MMETSP0209-20121228/9627_1 /TAXON_ID=665100 ORGANISM="Litonotus pictus, Strain P1" /NCGR_SAMPLE_ID=MMETSP0209 /ASSEMBLY_ACC=CAM_ASM_000301 /LENGTH=593 /DNA_ID=CAMNT_0010812747 /DNA_START=168 /DNA_END=1949 /DNA_ORIENTATION=-